MRVGIRVQCSVCHNTKQPIGRSAPMDSHYCSLECDGYMKDPKPGSLWPGETEEEFGYPIGSDGTESVENNGNKN